MRANVIPGAAYSRASALPRPLLAPVITMLPTPDSGIFQAKFRRNG
jgi:hypothetical protein